MHYKRHALLFLMSTYFLCVFHLVAAEVGSNSLNRISVYLPPGECLDLQSNNFTFPPPDCGGLPPGDCLYLQASNFTLLPPDCNGGGPATPLLTVPTSDSDGNFNVAWNASIGATHYELRTDFDGILYTGASRTLSQNKPNGRYGYKVRACNASLCSSYSAGKFITINKTTSSERNIIYIHTDILGTPIAETDKNGVIQ